MKDQLLVTEKVNKWRPVQTLATTRNNVVSFCAMCANARNNMLGLYWDENTKDSGTFSISDAMLIPCLHVFVWICGMYCACTGATLLDVLCKRTQHCWTTLRWRRNNRNVCTCWLWSLTSFKLHPTTSNKSQQHTTWSANACNKLGPTMLRAFARALRILKFVSKEVDKGSIFYRQWIYFDAFYALEWGKTCSIE